MAAKEIDRRFNPARGAVIVTVEDDMGTVSLHSVHISHDHELCPGCGRQVGRGASGDVDVEAAIAGILKETDARAQKLMPKFQAAGWRGK